MVGRRVAVIILVLLLLPLAHAYGVEKVWVDWRGDEVRSISPNATLPQVILKVRLTNDFADCMPGGKLAESACTVSIKAAALSTIPSERTFLNDTRLQVRSCENTTGAIICSSAPFTFSTKTATNPVSYSLRTGSTMTGWSTTNVPIIIDTTHPKTVRLDIGHCDDERCYASTVRPTPYVVGFDDAQTSFAFRQVFIGSEGAASRVANCTGKTCIGEIKVPCMGDGDKRTIGITSIGGVESREDSQNSVTALEREVICTSASPKFLTEFTVTPGGTLGVPVAGNSVTYKTTIRVPHGEPRAVLYSEKINGKTETLATCAQESADAEVWSCTWSVNGLKAGKHDVHFTVFSATGNKDDSKKLVLTVLNLTMPKNNKTGVDFFMAQKKEVIPERINRLALDLAASNYLPYPAYVVYDLQPNKSGVSIIRQELDQCWYKLPNETNYNNSRKYNLFSRDRGESRVLYPAYDHDKDNRLNLQLRADRDVLALSDTFDVTCQLKLIVKDGGNVYAVPELENMTFKIGLRESALGQPGEEFVNRIKEEEERLSGSDQKFLTNLRTARATLDGVCQVVDGINTLGSTGAGLIATGEMLKGVPIIGQIIGPIIKGTGNTMNVGAQTAHSTTWFSADGKSGWINQICRQVNCRGVVDENGNGFEGLWGKDDSLGDGFATSTTNNINALGARGGAAGQFVAEELTNNLNEPRYQDSFVMSAIHGCVGGMIYNVGKWQDINCGYLQCLKEQSINGQSVAVCEQARDAKICMQVTGELMELPWARVITNLQRNLDDMIKNAPGLMVKFFGNKACTPYLKPGADPQWPEIGCRLLKATTDMVDYSKQTNQLFNPPMQDDAICLQALCNKEDGDCKRSYNAVEKYSQYASYLQLQAWINNKQKQSGDKNQNEQARLQALAVRTAINGKAGDYQQRNAYVVHIVSSPRDGEHAVVGRTLGGTIETLGYISTEAYLQYATGETHTSEVYGEYVEVVTTRETLELSEFNSDVVGRLIPVQHNPSSSLSYIDGQYVVMRKEGGQYLRIGTLSTEDQESLDRWWADNNIDQSLKQDPELFNAVLAAAEEGVILNTEADVDEYLRMQESRTTFGSSPNAENVQKQSTLIAQYAECAQNSKCTGEQLKKYEAALAAENVFITKNGVGFKTGQSASSALTSMLNDRRTAGQCTGNVCYPEHESTSRAYVYDEKSGKWEQLRIVDYDTATSAANAERNIQYWKTFDLIANIAVKWAYDEGYLNFLQTSSYGSWGRDVSQWSDTYISPEGWQRNICHNIYDIQDNDDGVILELSDQGFTKVSGTFAAEVREITNETGTSYAYIYTIYITNPQRPVPQGQRSNGETYNYKMDMFFDQPKQDTCVLSSCEPKKDMIDGRFKLNEGTSFAKADGPRRGVTYLPVQYQRFCVTFDKPFPGPGGKTSYCREIKENVYATGSPYVPGRDGATGSNTWGSGAGGSSGSTTTNPDPDGTGNLEGEV